MLALYRSRFKLCRIISSLPSPSPLSLMFLSLPLDSQNDSAVDVAALLIVGSFALAALMGLLGYQLLKRILGGKSKSPLGIGSATTPPATPIARNPMELSSELLLRCIPKSIIPLGMGARLRGYTDITEDSVDDPHSVGSAGSPSVTSKSNDSDSSFESALTHIMEISPYNK